MDTPATAQELELLLEHAAWLSGLARHLVRDPEEAQEVVQETWLAALRGPRPARPGATRSWLAKVARNAARQRSRRAGARAAVEERGREGGLAASAAELVERAQVQRRLMEGVLALSEPYREALLLRYFEDLSGADIARQLGVPASTIRTRLARGLAELRARLADPQGKEPGGLAALLAPLVGADRGGSAAPPLAGLSSLAPLLGGSAVALTAKLAIPAVLAIALGVFLVQREGGGPAAPGATGIGPAADPTPAAPTQANPVEQPRSPQGSEREVVSLPTHPGEAHQPEEELLVEPTEEPERSILASFRHEDGSPVSGSVFLVVGQEVPEQLRRTPMEGVEGALRLYLDARGEARFEGLEYGTYSVAGLTADGVWREHNWIALGYVTTVARAELVVGGASLHGHAWDEYGDPLQGGRARPGAVRVSVLKEGASHPGAIHSQYPGPDGHFRFFGLQPGRWEVRTYPRQLEEKQFFEVPAGADQVELTVEL